MAINKIALNLMISQRFSSDRNDRSWNDLKYSKGEMRDNDIWLTRKHRSKLAGSAPQSANDGNRVVHFQILLHVSRCFIGAPFAVNHTAPAAIAYCALEISLYREVRKKSSLSVSAKLPRFSQNNYRNESYKITKFHFAID